MLKRMLGLAGAGLAACSLAAGAAHAAPITWTIDDSQSEILVSVPLLDTASAGNALEGTVVGDLEPGSISASGGSVGIVGDVVMYIAAFDVTLTGTGLAGALTGPSTPIVAGEADLLGWVLTLDQGILDLPGVLTLDLSVDPFEFELPSTVSTIVDLGGGLFQWAIPVSAVTQIDASALLPGLFIDVFVNGDILLTGTPVPEPGTALILLSGLTVLAARRRLA